MTANVLTYLDTYCERAGQMGLLAEPLNAVTNLFFILVSVLVARALLQRSNAPLKTCADLWLLTLALFCIGVGSGLWHLVPMRATMLMDVIPITLFINIYIISAMRRLFGFSWNKVVALWFVYMTASIVAQKILPATLLNGTIMYIPTYATLLLMTGALLLRDKVSGKIFVRAVLVWSAALFFRTVDMQLCSTLIIGTHFLWHTLNAWVLWRLMRVLVAKVESRA